LKDRKKIARDYKRMRNLFLFVAETLKKATGRFVSAGRHQLWKKQLKRFRLFRNYATEGRIALPLFMQVVQT